LEERDSKDVGYEEDRIAAIRLAAMVRVRMVHFNFDISELLTTINWSRDGLTSADILDVALWLAFADYRWK
jgi:hypothetical protein